MVTPNASLEGGHGAVLRGFAPALNYLTVALSPPPKLANWVHRTEVALTTGIQARQPWVLLVVQYLVYEKHS